MILIASLVDQPGLNSSYFLCLLSIKISQSHDSHEFNRFIQFDFLIDFSQFHSPTLD
jgi:hypothetical protein